MLAKEFKKDTENLETINYIQQSVKTANYVISNLLQYTKPLQLNKKKINMQKLLLTSMGKYGYSSRAHEIHPLTRRYKDLNHKKIA